MRARAIPLALRVAFKAGSSKLPGIPIKPVLGEGLAPVGRYSQEPKLFGNTILSLSPSSCSKSETTVERVAKDSAPASSTIPASWWEPTAPPKCARPSTTVTLKPLRASMRAESKPAMPPPTTSTLCSVDDEAGETAMILTSLCSYGCMQRDR